MVSVLSLATGRQHLHLRVAHIHLLFSSDRCFVSTDQSGVKCVECCTVCSDFLCVFGSPVLVDID